MVYIQCKVHEENWRQSYVTLNGKVNQRKSLQ